MPAARSSSGGAPLPKQGGKLSAAKAKSHSSITGSKRMDRTLTALIQAELWGDKNGVVDRSVPIGRVARRIVDDLEDRSQRLDWHLLALIWERMEGRVPDRMEIEATVRGVIALPVIKASEIDWTADAVAALSDAAHLPPALQLPASAIKTSEPSSDQDD